MEDVAVLDTVGLGHWVALKDGGDPGDCVRDGDSTMRVTPKLTAR